MAALNWGLFAISLGRHHFLLRPLSRGLGALNRRFERADLVRGRRQELVDDGRVAVGQRLPPRQAIADETHQVRAVDELAVIGRVRQVAAPKQKRREVSRRKSASGERALG
jgi:hypothetical protein